MLIPQDAPRTSATVQGITIQFPTLFPDSCLDASKEFLDSVGVLPAVAASILQAVIVGENPRNNIANQIKTDVYGPALIACGYGKTLDDGKVVPDWAAAGAPSTNISDLDDSVKSQLATAVDTVKAQEIVDAYLISYTPGQPRRAAHAPVLDPVEAKARELAKEGLAGSWASTTFTWEGQPYKGISLHPRALSYKAADALRNEKGLSSLAVYIEDKITAAVEERPYFRKQATKLLEEAGKVASELESDPFAS